MFQDTKLALPLACTFDSRRLTSLRKATKSYGEPNTRFSSYCRIPRGDVPFTWRLGVGQSAGVFTGTRRHSFLVMTRDLHDAMTFWDEVLPSDLHGFISR
jgi:hypothetical protein